MQKNKLFVLSLLSFSAVSMIAVEAEIVPATGEVAPVRSETVVTPRVVGKPKRSVDASVSTESATPASTPAVEASASTASTATEAKPAATAEVSAQAVSAQRWYESFSRPTPGTVAAASVAAFGAVKQTASKLSLPNLSLPNLSLPSESSVDGYYTTAKASARAAHDQASAAYGKVHARVSTQTWLRSSLQKPAAIAICAAPVYIAYRGVKAVASDINSGYSRVKSVFGFAPKTN